MTKPSVPPVHNDPCPCGSGSMYQDCCLPGQEHAPSGSGHGSGISAELRRELESRAFGSVEDAQGFAESFMARRNRAALEEFQGLSPEQMSALLYAPFDSPRFVSFPESIATAPEAPILTLFMLLTDAIGEQGLKCTGKGNLPRAFCRDAAEAYFSKDEYERFSRITRVSTETDFNELHATRLTAGMAGLVRKHRGRFSLTRECRKLLADNGPGGVYPRLLRANATSYNWAYADLYPDLPFIQHSFLFTLYLLHRHGAGARPGTFYEDAYLRAFPVLLEEIEPQDYAPPERQLRNCYTLRTLVRFAGFVGLAAVEKVSAKLSPAVEYRITKKPLLDQSVHFHL